MIPFPGRGRGGRGAGSACAPAFVGRGRRRNSVLSVATKGSDPSGRPVVSAWRSRVSAAASGSNFGDNAFHLIGCGALAELNALSR
jgi:hypothetical protein